MDTSRGRKIRKYFKPFPWRSLAVLAVASPGLLQDGLGAWGGLAAPVVAAVLGYLVWWSRKPSEQQLDRWRQEAIEQLESRAMQKIGLERDHWTRDPVTITGPAIGDVPAQFMMKKGKDKTIRFSPVHVTMIFFTQNHLSAYQCALDLTTGKSLNEATDEYFYDDIVSVATKSESVTYEVSRLSRALVKRLSKKKDIVVDGKLQLNCAERFVLTTSGGTGVEVLLRDPVFIKSSGGGEILTNLADSAVQSIRSMLRERKSAMLPMGIPSSFPGDGIDAWGVMHAPPPGQFPTGGGYPAGYPQGLTPPPGGTQGSMPAQSPPQYPGFAPTPGVPAPAMAAHLPAKDVTPAPTQTMALSAPAAVVASPAAVVASPAAVVASPAAVNPVTSQPPGLPNFDEGLWNWMTSKNHKSMFHPVAGVWILGLDWVLFSGNAVSLGLLTFVMMVMGFFLGSLGTFLSQLHYAGNSLQASLIKGFLGGVIVGSPMPVAGTLVGAMIIGMSGLSSVATKLPGARA